MVNATEKILAQFHHDATRMMDILLAVQQKFGYIHRDAVATIARELSLSVIDVEQKISFYHFFAEQSRGKYTIYLNNSVAATMNGHAKIVEAFERETGCKFGSVSRDGLIGLFHTSCIGMNDQEPAAIINDRVFTRLTPYRVRQIVRDIRAGKPAAEMMTEGLGDGENSNELIRSMVYNNIRLKGPILDENYKIGAGIKKVSQMTPEQVIEVIKDSNIRGRGGAGFPTGLKWEFCRRAAGSQKYIFCNADEGEPGTFKDRVILTQFPRLVFEGMIIAGRAVGATQGILYVRHEYRYLGQWLESVLDGARRKGYLGKTIAGVEGFDFDIRIQFGAGAYVCGEESALIESAEGKRGEPRDRPPFPVEKGYLDQPTVVNNVETFCSVVKIILNGGEWYRSLGTKDSTGTKLLSVSGDCMHPGVYEIEWGFSVNDVLDMVGGYDPQAVQVGGPSGSLIGPDEFDRTLSYSDLSTGGSLIIFGKQRDLLKDVVLNFTDFFVEESCGACTPCRVIPVLLKQKLERIIAGRGIMKDLNDMVAWSKIMKANRCGLGQTASNPVTSSIRNFRHLYIERVHQDKEYEIGFDLDRAIQDGAHAAGRKPVLEENHYE